MGPPAGPRSESGDSLVPERSDTSHLISARHSSTTMQLHSVLPRPLLTMPPRRPPPPESALKRMLKVFSAAVPAKVSPAPYNTPESVEPRCCAMRDPVPRGFFVLRQIASISGGSAASRASGVLLRRGGRGCVQHLTQAGAVLQADPGGVRRSNKRGSWFNPEVLANQKVSPSLLQRVALTGCRQ